MIKYNSGRFIFLFDKTGTTIERVVDTKYDAVYTNEHPAFKKVCQIALESLSFSELEEIQGKLINDGIWLRTVRKLMFKKKKKEN